MKALVYLTSFALVCSLNACTHMVGKDYPKYLENNVGESQLPATDKADQYYLPPQTKSFSYEFRSFITGVGNKWVVEIGKMLDDTLKSVDVQKAFGTLAAVDSESAPGTTLVFELQDYKFEDFRAKISLNVKLMKTGTPAFEKNYTKEGKEQGGKMFLGGTFAQKNAVQQSTKLVLDEILRELIADLSGLQ